MSDDIKNEVIANNHSVEVWNELTGTIMVFDWNELNALIAEMKIKAVEAFGEEPVTE